MFHWKVKYILQEVYFITVVPPTFKPASACRQLSHLDVQSYSVRKLALSSKLEEFLVVEQKAVVDSCMKMFTRLNLSQ
jgi:hypothetical protein